MALLQGSKPVATPLNKKDPATSAG